MADSIRSAGFDIGIRIKGFEELTKLDNHVDKLLSKFQKLEKLSVIDVPTPNSNGLDNLDGKLNRVNDRLKDVKRNSEITPRVNTSGIDAFTRSANNAHALTRKNISANNDYTKSFNYMLPTVNRTTDTVNRKLDSVGSHARRTANDNGVLNGSYERLGNATSTTATRLERLNTRTTSASEGFNSISETGSGAIDVFNSMTMAVVPLGLALKNAFEQATKLADEYNTITQLEIANDVKPAEAHHTIKRMKHDNRALSLKYGIDQLELANGSEELIRRGYSAKQDIASHKYFAQAALATKENYDDIINANAPVLEQFGYKNKAGNSVKKMEKYSRKVLNKMAYVADITSGDNKSFGESFKYMGTAMHQNHQSLDVALGALGTLSNFGMEGSIAGTSLRQILSRMNRARKSKTIKGALLDFGLKPDDLYNKKGNLKPLNKIFDMLRRGAKSHKMTSGVLSGDLQEIFGQTSFNAAQTLLDHSKDWKKNIGVSKVAESKNYISTLSKKNLGTLEGQIKLTKAKLNDVGMSFAREIAPAVTLVLKGLNKVLDVMGSLPKPVKKAMTFMTATGASIGAVKLGSGLLGNVGKLFGITKGAKTAGSVLSVGAGATTATGWLGKARMASGGKLLTAGNVVSVGAGALDGGVSLAKGYELNQKGKYADRNHAVGQGVGELAGTGIGFGVGALFGLGPVGAMVGSQLGKFVGGIGGDAVTGYNMKHAPKNKFSGENLGWSFHNWQREIGTAWNRKGGAGENIHNFTKTFGENWRGTGRRLGSFGQWASDSWNGTKDNVRSFGQWAGDSWNGTKKNVGNFVGGIGKGVNYVASGQIGSDAHKLWKKGVDNSHNFFTSLPKNFSNFKNTVGKTWNDTWSAIDENRYFKTFKKGGKFAVIKLAFTDLEKNTRSFRQNFGKAWNNTWKDVNNNRYVKAFKKHKFVRTAFSDVEKNTRKFRQDFGKTWSNTWKTAGTNLGDFKKNVNKKWSSSLTNIESNFSNFKKTLSKNWSKFWTSLEDRMESFGKWVGDSWNGTINNILGTANDINRAFGGDGKAFNYVGGKKKTAKKRKSKATTMGAYANGGRITRTNYALVGENGAELAYRKNGSKARLLGMNGASIEKVHAGEHILNAKDTSKVLSGSLGATLPAYAGGTTSLSGNSKGRKNAYDSIGKQAKKTKNSVLSTTHSLEKSLNKDMDKIHDGVIDTGDKTAKGYHKKFSKLKGYTSDAMEGVRKALNTGIAGINKMLVQFGGNSSVIKPVKFAKGSNGKLQHNTLAMVNDAKSGPRQEAIIRDNNILLPQGEDVILPLRKNDQVLNGTQTSKLAEIMGAKRFAKGSGVSDSQLAKIAKNSAKQPKRSFDDMFSKNVRAHGTDIMKGVTTASKNASNKLGTNWSKAMWGVITEAMGESDGHGGTREAFLKYAESNFSGKPYRMGGMGPEFFDCSGMVATALKHFGINIGRTTVAMQNSSGVQYLGKNIDKTRAGDLAIYGHGTGAAGHVGIIKNPAKDSMFNATPPSARVTSVSAPKSLGYGFYRVNGLHDAKAKTDRANMRLRSLAKNELGSKALSWISKHLGETIDSNFSIGGDIATRANQLAKALKQLDPKATKNGITAIVGNWLMESGLNSSAVNASGGASGLGQWLGGRLGNLKQFAKKRGKSWTDVSTQLLFALKHDGSDSATFRRILRGKGSVEALATQFSNQWERGGYTAQHVSKAKEVAGMLKFRTGGKPPLNTPVRVNEEGGEVAEFRDPVHIYSKDDAKRTFDIDDTKKKAVENIGNARKQQITINVTGNYIDTKDREQRLVAQIREIAHSVVVNDFQNLTDNFGDDASQY